MVGVWTGCGFDTIPVIFPPPDILGYDDCVEPIVHDGAPVILEEPIIIIP